MIPRSTILKIRYTLFTNQNINIKLCEILRVFEVKEFFESFTLWVVSK